MKGKEGLIKWGRAGVGKGEEREHSGPTRQACKNLKRPWAVFPNAGPGKPRF